MHERLSFNDFLWLAIFGISQLWTKYARFEQLFPKNFQANYPSFVTIIKPLNNKIGETFCEGLKLMCELFEIDGQKDFEKLTIFWKSSKQFIIELTQRNSY